MTHALEKGGSTLSLPPTPPLPRPELPGKVPIPGCSGQQKVGVYIPDQELSPPHTSQRKLVQRPFYFHLKSMLKKKVFNDNC